MRKFSILIHDHEHGHDRRDRLAPLLRRWQTAHMSKAVPPVQQLAAGAALPDFFHYLGLSIDRATADEAVLRMQVPAGLRSPYGPVHGGAIAALIDTAIGVAVACRLTHGERTATHQLSINYISFAEQPVIIATARVLRLGRSVAHTEAEACGEDGTLIARALATFGIFRQT